MCSIGLRNSFWRTAFCRTHSVKYLIKEITTPSVSVQNWTTLKEGIVFHKKITSYVLNALWSILAIHWWSATVIPWIIASECCNARAKLWAFHERNSPRWAWQENFQFWRWLSWLHLGHLIWALSPISTVPPQLWWLQVVTEFLLSQLTAGQAICKV